MKEKISIAIIDPVVLAIMFLLGISCVAHSAESGTSEGVSDAFVIQDVREQLQAYPHVDVEAEDGVVALKGRVKSEDDMNRVLANARNAEGVYRIRNMLTFASKPLASGARAPAAGEIGQDLALNNQVIDTLRPFRDVRTTSRDGVVTLTGRVDDETERDQAARMAGEVSGVRSVTNELRIQPPDMRTEEDIAHDRRIAAAVKRRIEADKRLEASNIRVSGNEGVMYMTGDVADTTQIRIAGEEARKIKGVNRVINRLTVL